jgi:hypothetical protein
MKKLVAVLLAVAAVAAGLAVSATAAPKHPSTLTVVGKNAGTVFVTKDGVSLKYPGALVTGDRIFSQERDYIAGKAAGFDNEACTVTFNGNDFCHDVAVLSGRGEIELTYLLVGRNATAFGPHHFAGIIDGGTGEFQNARGAFQAIGLAKGTIVTVPLG